MNILELIAANTAALEANTAALLGASTGESSDAAPAKPAAKPGAKPAAKPAAKPKGPTRDEMISALGEVKEKFGAADAKAIITKQGGASKMAEIEDDKIEAVFKAAQAKLEGGAEGGDGDDDGL